jgi:hypothetical protein
MKRTSNNGRRKPGKTDIRPVKRTIVMDLDSTDVASIEVFLHDDRDGPNVPVPHRPEVLHILQDTYSLETSPAVDMTLLARNRYGNKSA